MSRIRGGCSVIDWNELYEQVWLMWQDPMSDAADVIDLFKAAIEADDD